MSARAVVVVQATTTNFTPSPTKSGVEDADRTVTRTRKARTA